MTMATGPTWGTAGGLRVLVVDDEQPVRDELAWLLGRDPRVAQVGTAGSGEEALRVLEDADADAVFLDIAMPGLSGVDLARVLARFRRRPRVVFVTAHDEHAVDAFDLHAVDYLLKPVRPARLSEAVRRVAADRGDGEAPASPAAAGPDDEVIAVDRAGVTRFVARSEVVWVEAHGDYTRLHTTAGEHLVRVPLTALAERWAGAGYLRIHRSLLVDTARIVEVRNHAGRTTVLVRGADGPVELQVARRHGRELRDVLGRRSPA